MHEYQNYKIGVGSKSTKSSSTIGSIGSRRRAGSMAASSRLLGKPNSVKRTSKIANDDPDNSEDEYDDDEFEPDEAEQIKIQIERIEDKI